jgi:hypothetical protein
VDKCATGEVQLHCLGGFIVTQVYGAPRLTADVDVLSIVPYDELAQLLEHAGKNSELHKKYDVYLDYVGVCNYPDSYEDRLTKVFPAAYKHLRLFALDPYDLALAKLERNYPA